MKKRDIAIVAGLTVVVVAVLIYGFSLSGSPLRLRDEKFDQTRMSNFSELSNTIDSYVNENKKLPPTLGDLPSYSASFTHDPQTGTLYEYTITGTSTYTLCTTFALSSADEHDNYFYYSAPTPYGSAPSKHAAGHDCLSYSVNGFAKP